MRKHILKRGSLATEVKTMLGDTVFSQKVENISYRARQGGRDDIAYLTILQVLWLPNVLAFQKTKKLY